MCMYVWVPVLSSWDLITALLIGYTPKQKVKKKKTPKSQLTAEQPLTKKHAGTYQNRYPTSKDKEATSRQ